MLLAMKYGEPCVYDGMPNHHCSIVEKKLDAFHTSGIYPYKARSGLMKFFSQEINRPAHFLTCLQNGRRWEERDGGYCLERIVKKGQRNYISEHPKR